MELVSTVAEIGTILLLCVFIFTSTLYSIAELFPLNWKPILKLREWKAANTLELLKHLNINVEKITESNFFSEFPIHYNNYEKLKRVTENLCNKYTEMIPTEIGRTEPFQQIKFVNIMGASTRPDVAIRCAQIIAQTMKHESQLVKTFDFICSPKEGTPFIGYELAKILEKPFVLYKEPQKITFTTNEKVSPHFDGYLPPVGNTGLLIDDSSTGGSMLINAAFRLRSLGYKVNSAVVVFQPLGKGVYQNLKEKQIEFIPVIKIVVREET